MDPSDLPSSIVEPAAYARLLKAIRAEIAAGKKIIAQTVAVTNWKVGKHISDFILKGKDRAGYGEHIYEKLAKDLNSSVNNLERMVRFSRECSISDARQKLTWIHYRMLLALRDSSARQQLTQRTITRENRVPNYLPRTRCCGGELFFRGKRKKMVVTQRDYAIMHSKQDWKFYQRLGGL